MSFFLFLSFFFLSLGPRSFRWRPTSKATLFNGLFSAPTESLEINFKVSSALVEIVWRINTKPRYILAKGGITSSDIATKALEAKRAKIVGQALAGVPLWLLGDESRHPVVPYIVFPGNVGDHTALAEVVKCWGHPAKISSTKELLLKKADMLLELLMSIVWKGWMQLSLLLKKKEVQPFYRYTLGP